MLRIFEPILGEKAQSLRMLLSFVHCCNTNKRYAVAGEHTRSIQIATPSVGGLMKYAVKTMTCLGCKTAMKPSNSIKGLSDYMYLFIFTYSYTLIDGAVCNNCRPKLGDLHFKQVCLLISLSLMLTHSSRLH